MIEIVSVNVLGANVFGTFMDTSAGYQRFSGFSLDVETDPRELTRTEIIQLLEEQSTT